MAELKDLVRETFKVFIEDLLKVVVLTIACTVIFNHIRDISVNDLFCEMF